MNFLSPWYIPAIAAAATIPPLVLLYFLKLKRRELPIASTLLWKRAVQDLQVNAPFQRLRKNLLLFLQLLILLLAVFALADPISAGKRDVEENLTLLIDSSGSMSAREADGRSRLQVAKDEAIRVVDAMRPEQRAMVIDFARRARVLAPFTPDKQALRQAIASIGPTDEPGTLTEAVQLAEAHSTPIGENIGVNEDIATAHHLLFSDARLPDAAEVAVQRGKLEVVRVGQAAENVGIVALDVRRNYERPEQVSVLARVRNFGTQPVARDVSLLVDGDLKDVRSLPEMVPLAPAGLIGTSNLSAMPPEGNEAIAAFELVIDRGALIEVRLAGEDALAADDHVAAVVAAPRALSVLLVTPGNRYLRDLIAAMPLSRHDVWSPQDYQSRPDGELIDAGRCKYDVVIIDGHNTDRLPPGNYVFFGGIPVVEEVARTGTVKGEPFLDWDETHPILRYVAVQPINVFTWGKLELPPQAHRLIESQSGPVLALLREPRHQYLLCAFSFFDDSREYLNTDWVFQESLVVFMHNALRFLAGESSDGQTASVAPGEAFSVAAEPGRDELTIRRPDGRSESAPVRAGGLATYGRTDRVGVYAIDSKVAGEQTRTVNLLSEAESFIAPNQAFQIAAGELVQGQGAEDFQKPLWPLALMILGGILLLEWIIYNKRVFI